MNGVTAEVAQNYIDKHYVTRAELARLAGISEVQILELIAAKCVPPHSYEVRAETVYVSAFGKYKLPLPPRYYYHPRLVNWIQTAISLAEKHPLATVAEMVRTAFEDDIDRVLDGHPMPWPDGKGHVWAYLLDGSWSLCLKELDVPGLVQKEIARETIARIASASSGRDITADERDQLEGAIEQYNQATLPFSPHEVGDSSRCLEIGAVAKKFGLAGQCTTVAAE